MNTIVRMAANCSNQKALGIRFEPKSHLFNYLRTNLKVPGIQARHIDSTAPQDGGQPYPMLFIPQQYLSILHQVVKDYQLDVLGSMKDKEGIQ